MPVYADEVYDWSGAYFGVQLGGQSVNINTQVGAVGPGLPIGGGSGLLAGVFAGANIQDGNFVYGVEGDLEYSSFNVRAGCPGTDYVCENKIDVQGSLRGRVGYAADSVLFYATGGLAVANFTTTQFSDTDLDFLGSDTSVRYGWTVGAGIEAGLTDNVTGRVEYRYTDLGTDSYSLNGSDYTDVRINTHSLRAGLAYKF